MSEPITPKAQQHVVEGEFIETSSASNTKPDDKPVTAKKITWPQPIWLWLAVMLVSGTALAFALAAWLALNQPSPEAQLTQQLSHQVELQQAKIEALERELNAQQQQQQKLDQAWLSVTQALENNASQGEQTESTPPSIDMTAFDQAWSAWQADVNARLGRLNQQLEQALEKGKIQTDLDTFEQQVDAQLTQIKQQMDKLNQAQQAWSEEWSPKIRDLGEHLNGLAEQQAQWMARIKPQIEETVTEIQPQLDGIFSRFNQLFTIKKHEASPQAESAQ